jgi:hypothetical protein
LFPVFCLILFIFLRVSISLLISSFIAFTVFFISSSFLSLSFF